METIKNPELELAYNFVQYTNRNIYLTGKAGTGKTTFLRQLKSQSPKRMVIVAPTGVAAINAGGVTIHSFFQLPFGPILPIERRESPFMATQYKMSRDKINIIRSLDLLVIDEISMVRADLLDGIDDILRRYRRNNNPFGGVQLLMIGDIQQLPPVVRNEDWAMLQSYYKSLFFFDSIALNKTNYVSIELKHIYRQSNEVFISILNKIRDNRLDKVAMDELNKRYIPNFKPNPNDGYITLTTHNRQAQELNDSKLREIPLMQHLFRADITGDFPEMSYPTERELLLKVGAQVMFLKNDSSRERLYFNGKIGTILSIDSDGIQIKCPDLPLPITLGKEKWDNMKYSLNETTKEIDEKVIGSFVQYPLKLAWAITIHKSQGLTFEKAIIYAGSAFAHGQVYVALSRCKSLEGLVLGTPIDINGIISDGEIKEFNHKMEENRPDQKVLEQSRHEYQLALILDLFDYKSVLYNLITIQKQAKEHVTILPADFSNKVVETINELRTSCIEVSDKFAVQLTQMAAQSIDIESNAALQDRIVKAVTYFSEKTETLITELTTHFVFELDNKAVLKLIIEPLERIFSELKIKQATLSACENGFVFKDFLSIRAKAQIEEPQRKKSAVNYSKNDDNQLVSILKSYRNDKAAEFGVDVYMVLSQKSIQALSQIMPTSMKELKGIHGIGPQKIKQFGQDILDIILKYRQDNHIETVVLPEDNRVEEPIKTSKSPKIDSKQVSFDLFQSGKSVEEIAAERNFSPTTIEGHLAHFIANGKLSIEKFMPPERVLMIANAFKKAETTSLTPVKEMLGEGFSYGELRMVLAYMKIENV